MHIYPWQNYPPPHQLGTDALNTTTSNLADLLADLPPSIKHRCLEYHYTKLGISTGRSTPQSIEHRSLEYHYTKLGRSTPSIEQRCLAYCYTKIDRSTGRSTPQSIKHSCLEYHGPIAESTCSLRAHAKLSVAPASLWPDQSHLQVYDQSPSSLLPDQRHLQVQCQTRVTFRFTARVIFKFTPSGETVIDGRWSAKEQGTFKFTGRVTFKFIPPFETVTDDRSSIGRYMCSSLLLNFTAQVYSTSLTVSFTPHQSSTHLWNTTTPKKFHI